MMVFAISGDKRNNMGEGFNVLGVRSVLSEGPLPTTRRADANLVLAPVLVHPCPTNHHHRLKTHDARTNGRQQALT
jgi:hypothetical protein